MKYILFSFLLSSSLTASTLSMSELQLIVNEDVIEYFSTDITNMADPLVAENITKHQLKSSSSKELATISSEVSAKIYNIEAAEAFYTDYSCLTTLIDTGKVWKVSQTQCQIKPEF